MCGANVFVRNARDVSVCMPTVANVGEEDCAGLCAFVRACGRAMARGDDGEWNCVERLWCYVVKANKRRVEQVLVTAPELKLVPSPT